MIKCGRKGVRQDIDKHNYISKLIMIIGGTVVLINIVIYV